MVGMFKNLEYKQELSIIYHFHNDIEIDEIPLRLNYNTVENNFIDVLLNFPESNERLSFKVESLIVNSVIQSCSILDISKSK